MDERILYLFLLFFMAVVNADVKESETTKELPSQEMLEFLADFETKDGNWIDPLELLDMFGKSESKEAIEND